MQSVDALASDNRLKCQSSKGRLPVGAIPVPNFHDSSPVEISFVQRQLEGVVEKRATGVCMHGSPLECPPLLFPGIPKAFAQGDLEQEQKAH